MIGRGGKTMDYITAKQAAIKWGISERRVHKLCEDGRIEGQIRFASVWMIPANAKKPADRRKNNVAPIRKPKRAEDE